MDKSELASHHHIHQPVIAVDDVVSDLIRRNLSVELLEKLSGAGDLGFFDVAKLHAGHRALGLSNEVDVLDRAFFEADGPVGVVVADGRGDMEAAWELGVDHDFCAGVEASDKVAFDRAVGDGVVIDVTL